MSDTTATIQQFHLTCLGRNSPVRADAPITVPVVGGSHCNVCVRLPSGETTSFDRETGQDVCRAYHNCWPSWWQLVITDGKEKDDASRSR